MSDPKSYLVEYEYQYEDGSVKKSIEYHGNDCVIVRQESKTEKVKIRIPKEMMSNFIRIIESPINE